MALYSFAVVVFGFLVFWFFTSMLFASSFPPPPELRNKRILLLIGHPDDEAMFFGPAIIALTSPTNGNEVKIVCLSTGNAIGQGEIRKGELLNSARRLGIRHDEDVCIVDDPRFQDGGQNDWKKEEIADLLAHLFTSQATPKSNASVSSSSGSSCSTSKQRPEARQQQQLPDPTAITTSPTPPETLITTPEVIVTFDPHGISTHPNHCACYYGAAHFLYKQLKRSNNPSKPTPSTEITLYTLTTLPLLRKYISVLDAPMTLLTIISDLLLSRLKSSTRTRRGTGTSKSTRTGRGDRVLFVSGFHDYARAVGAMVYAHQTQMLWFRWGWILAGRYMVVNDLKRERIVS